LHKLLESNTHKQYSVHPSRIALYPPTRRLVAASCCGTASSMDLVLALQQDDVAKVKRLCSAVPGICDFKVQGWTPLHFACDGNATRRGLICAKCLLDAGANVHSQNSQGETALHLAVDSTWHEMVDLLLRASREEVNVPVRSMHLERGVSLKSVSHVASFLFPRTNWGVLHCMLHANAVILF
jgi:hypothetical protein